MKTLKIIYASLFVIGLFLGNDYISCQDGQDLVNGNLIQFNDNGAWCWYQDERAVIDIADGKLITGSDASGSGTGGNSRNGQVEGVIYNLETGLLEKSTFRITGCDDHNVPGFIIRPDGQYFSMYADHYDRWNSRYRIFNGSSWSGEQQFDWTTIPGGTDYTIAYSNLYYLSEEDRMYNFARANHRCPNFIYSDDWGDTWLFGGQLSTNNTSSYNKGYYKYWGNGVDRIDFILTEEHPRDGLTSIYHGYIQNGKTYSTNGTLVDANIFDATGLPTFEDFTLVFADNTIIDGDAMRKIWNADLVRYDDGVIAAILTCRINNAQNGGDNSINPDHGLIYCRYDGESWSYTYLSQAGKKMYGSEADYTGLGALDPNDPNTVFISTHVDPRDDTELGNREIFKGLTDDNGNSWNWTAITRNSTRNNYRPIAPVWDENNTTLLWMRGTYFSAQNFDMTIVGIIENSLEGNDLMTYEDASASNTSMTDNSPLTPTGPNSNAGSADNQWHERTGFGNGGSVFTSAETGGENAPSLKTSIKAGDEGKFDVWVNFWSDPSSDWRIKAGLSENKMQIFRHIACKQVEAGDHNTLIEISGDDNTFLYQAYLGRVETGSDSIFEIFIDDHAIETGTSDNLIGNETRTWYDGISYTMPLYVTIDVLELTLSDSANSVSSFEVFSNTNWNISSSGAWLSPNIVSGMNDDTVILTALANVSDTARMAIVTTSTDHIKDQIIMVSQKPVSPDLYISDTELSIEYAENSITTFDINSNTFWNISSSEYWLNADIVSGINNKTITLTASINHTGIPRIASIIISADNVVPHTITVTQEFYLLLFVSPSEITFNGEASGTKTFNIESNTNWNISITETWLTASTVNGTGNETIILTIEENTYNTDRQAFVTVSAAGVPDQIIEITQTNNPIESLADNNNDIGYIFPNPATDKLNIRLSVLPAHIKLYTYDGKQVLYLNAESYDSEIDMTNLNNGVYILQIISERQTFTRKIIKQ